MKFNRSKSNLILLLALLALGAGFLLVNLYDSSATVLAAGPTLGPGVGTGALATDASGNLSIGTSPSSSVKLLIQAPNALSTNYALSVIKQNGTAIIQAGNDGTVTIPGLIGGAGVSANSVSAGQFGANTGNGNFSFPASLGVGTSTPSNTLDVIGSVRMHSGAFGANGFVFSQDGTGNLDVNYTTGSSTIFSNPLTLAFGGNVGIGTSTTPGANLTVQQSNNTQNTAGLKLIASGLADDFSLFEGGDHNSYLWNGGTGGMTMWVNNGTQAMTIATSGNVGIGTATPGAKLDVAGGINLTADGTHDAALKVGYTATAPAGYYAVYAP